MALRARRGVDEAGVEGDVAGLLQQLGDRRSRRCPRWPRPAGGRGSCRRPCRVAPAVAVVRHVDPSSTSGAAPRSVRRTRSAHRDATPAPAAPPGIGPTAQRQTAARPAAIALVGGGQRDPHVLGARPRRRSCPAPRGCRGRPAAPTVAQRVLAPGRPEVEARLGVVDPEAGAPRAAARSSVAPRARTAPSARRRARRRRGRRRMRLLHRPRHDHARRACAPRAAAAPAPGRRRRTPRGSRRGWTAWTASRRRAGPRGCRRRPAGRGCSASSGSAAPVAASRARRSTRRWRRRRRAARAQATTLARCSTPSTRPVGLPGLLSHNSFGVVAAVSGPSAARPSTASGVAPASRAPTS